jgi:hypothetical protein
MRENDAMEMCTRPATAACSVFTVEAFMSVAAKLFEAIKRFGRKPTSTVKPNDGIPTVNFDVSRVTDAVKADIRENIMLLEGIDKNQIDRIYDAAIRSVSAGRDLAVLCKALLELNINGMTTRRASEIALLLNNKATAVMQRERQEALGIKQALWLYSGAPCEINPKRPTGQDTAHRAANGKPFDVSKGLFLDGKWTWPGVEPGCRCVSKPIVPGFS